jgi:hypothetical protein
MGFIPKDARWYLAGLVLEHTIEGDPRNVVHVNTHLIAADSPEEAYRKANDLGRRGEIAYANTDGKTVRSVFRGLRGLDVIHDDLEDGAELFYEERVGISEVDLARWVTPKEELAVFAPRQVRSDKPNTMSQEVAEMLEAAGTWPPIDEGGHHSS